MHWTVAGANAIISLHCCVLSGRCEHDWAYRSTQTEPAVSNVSGNGRAPRTRCRFGPRALELTGRVGR